MTKKQDDSKRTAKTTDQPIVSDGNTPETQQPTQPARQAKPAKPPADSHHPKQQTKQQPQPEQAEPAQPEQPQQPQPDRAAQPERAAQPAEMGTAAPVGATVESRGSGGLARESRSQAANRWCREGRKAEVEARRDVVRKECRAAGMSRHESVDRSWEVVLDEFPPPGVEPIEAAVVVEAVKSPESPEETGVSGISGLPEGWPVLPSNASLQAEISWVTANRLRVRDGNAVDLSKALSPAPSHSALSWLETSILFPSKFADISVKATAQQEDDREHTRREKVSIEEIRGLLDEMSG